MAFHISPDTEKQTLVMRAMALGVFKESDRHTLRTMSANTLKEIIRAVNVPRAPVVRGNAFHASASDDRTDIINRLIASGPFTTSDKNALWQMSVETLRELAEEFLEPADELIANEMLPPSLGDAIRSRRR